MEQIRIIDVYNISKLDDYFASSMVDIAYIDKIDNNVVTLLLDNSIHLNNSDDKKWVTELINKALQECQEYSAKIVFKMD